MISTKNVNSSTATDKKNHELILYFHYYSYYSQKVLMVLYEKEIPFEKHVVDIVKGSQYQSWFLNMNAKGEVPVLQTGVEVIPDSIHIIDYLEDNFRGAIRLIPIENNSTRQKVIYFRNIIDQLPIRTLTMGSLFHSELIRSPKLPFIGPVRNLLANSEENIGKVLRKCADENPIHRDILIQKAEYHEGKTGILINKTKYLKVIDQFINVLDQIENELSQHIEGQEHWWLCAEKFTLADVALTVLLERLSQLGFDFQLWKNNKRPNIEKYYSRVQQRDSYKNIVPTYLIHTKMFIHTFQKPLIVGLSLSIIAGITAVYFIIKSQFY